MPPAEEKQEIEHETMSNKPLVGIIYPPPEVRNIVDKTASFVARNGPEFEIRIRQNEQNNPKFNFLNPNDPYHAYYQHKVKEFQEGKGQEPAVPRAAPSLARHQQEIKLPEPVQPKEPPPEYEFIADAPSISAFDLDVVKLTAQFVARNGRQFLTNLMNREKNYQFDFLRPQHSLFNYFTKLVEQYTKVLIPPKDLLPKLRKEADDPKLILDQVVYRVEWTKFQEREKRKEEEALERQRVAYAQVDWHDFVVVETVDFQPDEHGNFPPPTTPDEVGARVLAQERFTGGGADDEAVEMEVASSDEEDEADTEVQDMDEESEGEDEPKERPPPKAPAPPAQPPLPPSDAIQPPPLPPQPDQVIVRENYDPKMIKQSPKPTAAPDKYLVSPITGERIPADKVQEHMRIGLLDPNWIQQRDRSLAEKREQEEVYAAGSSIDSHLKQLAERRTDIFGSGAEEAQIGQKIGEEERKVEKVTWDGHSASMERVQQKARENISIEDQIATIHKSKGLVADEGKEKIGPSMPKAVAQPPLPPGTAPILPPPRPLIPPKPMPTAHPQQVAQPKTAAVPVMPPQPPPIPMQMQPPRAPQMMVMPPRPPTMIGPSSIVMGPPGMGPVAGYTPGPPRMMSQRAPMPGPPKSLAEEPPSKKTKTEDSLIPEMEFMRTHKSPVTFQVTIPNMPDKAEWKLNGQTISMTLPLTDAVSVVKAKLSEELSMPAGKQKLQFGGMFIKDSNTLAFYNITGAAPIQLQLKERGGRKK